MSFGTEQYVAAVEEPFLFSENTANAEGRARERCAVFQRLQSCHCPLCRAPPPSPRCLVCRHGGVELEWPAHPGGPNAQSQYDRRLSVRAHAFFWRSTEGTLQGSMASSQQHCNLMEQIKGAVSQTGKRFQAFSDL